MILKIQLKSLLFSFLYGCLFTLLLKINYKFIYYSKGVKKIIINLVFIIDNTLLYFIFLRYINNGIFHFYFLLAIIFGFIFVNLMSSIFLKKLKH